VKLTFDPARIILIALICTSCATAVLDSWNDESKVGEVIVGLCSYCSEPYEYQRRAALEIMRQECGEVFEIESSHFDFKFRYSWLAPKSFVYEFSCGASLVQ
jgi:hypothetical protein